MTDKIRITADRVISKSKGKTKFYSDEGSIVIESSKLITVYETQDELDAAAATDDAEQGVDAEQDEGSSQVSNDEQQADDTPTAASNSSKPKRSRGKGKEQMASKKKAAGKKKATRAASTGDGAMIRSIAGRDHDISGYEKVKNASGHTSYDNGDNVATTLRGKTLDEVYAFASKKLKEDEKALRNQYKSLNAGMQRMTLGNRLRKAMNAKAA